MPTLSLAAAEELVVDALTRAKTDPENAKSVARALVAAEAEGLKGHGLSRAPSYAAQAKIGKVDGFAKPSIEWKKPAAAVIDAANGFAFPAVDLAVNELPTSARKNGIAAAGICRSHHCGAAGHPVEKLAKAGLMALMFANTPGAIAPWGGSKAVFGTNPIAFSCPLPGKPPVVVDLSLSKSRAAIFLPRSRRTRKFRKAGRSMRTASRRPTRTRHFPAPCCRWATRREPRSR